MAHAVSALYSKFNRMSPVAAAMAALLHALVALAFFLELPRHEAEAAERVVEFTVEVPSAPPAEPQAPAAPAAQAAAPPPGVPPSPPPRLGLAPPRSLTPDPNAKPAAPQPGPTPPEKPTETTEPAKQEPAKQEPAKPEPEQQQAAATPPPPPPPEPKLEQVLPPIEAPPPPLTAQDFPKPAPPAPPKPPPPKAPPPQQQRALAPPPQQLQPSPLSRAPQQRPPADSQAAARPAPSPLTNPSSQYGQRKAEEDYLWLVIRKLSQYRYYPKSNVVSEEGVVVMRITIARDGRLLDVTLARSSGYPNLDNGIMDTLRQAAPFAPLPADISGDRHTFILPLNYTPHQR